MRLYRVGLIIGRFQMLHNGHAEIINKALEYCDRVVVFIGSAQESRTKKNPFSYNVREQMLNEVFAVEIASKRLLIRPLNDTGDGNNTKWGKYVLDTFKKEFHKQPDLYITGVEKERPSWFDNTIAPKMDELRISRKTVNTSASECRQFILDDNYDAWCENVDTALYDNFEYYKKLLKEVK